MELTELISEEIIALGRHADGRAAVIEDLGELMTRRGYIDPAYTASVLEREKEYPTGIALANGGIAIPHASPDGNVRKNGIAVLQLERPVCFHSMENAEDTVEAQIVFMMALKDSEEHLAILQKLFGMFQSEAAMEILRKTKDKNEFKATILENLK